MQVLQDGFSVFYKDLHSILLFFLVPLGYGLWMARVLPGGWKNKTWLLIPFSLVAGLIPVAVLSLLFSLLGWIQPEIMRVGNLCITIVSIAGLFGWIWIYGKKIRLGVPPVPFWIAVVTLFLFLVIRLAFVKVILLPPYSDGAEHYLMARDLLSPAVAPQGSHQLLKLLQGYYHFGFHGVLTWLVVNSGVPLDHAMVLAGQLLQVNIVLSVLFSIGLVTEKGLAAVAGALLGAVGWIMPAYAVNWAKYPTLAGLALFPVTIAIAFLLIQEQNKRPVHWFIGVPFILGMGLFHARTLVLLFLAAVVFGFVRILQFFPKKIISWFVILTAVIVGIIFSSQNYLMLIYCSKHCGALVGLAILLPLAAANLPYFSLGILLFVLGMLGVTRLPLPETLQTYSTFWLDGPFMEIAAFLPLALLGGFSVVGVMDRIKKIWIAAPFLTCLAGLLIWSHAQSGVLYPDGCCNYVYSDDLSAIEWMDVNLPEDATVVISGYAIGTSVVGTDAGVWIKPLTGRRVVVMTSTTNWEALEVIKELCRDEHVYIYASSKTGFEKNRFQRPDWYEPVYNLGDTEVIHARACDE